MSSVSSATPLVSVLTTSYNREAYIAETIESVLAQTMTDFEYIIVDDCSKDRSFEIAKSYAAKDSRIQVYRNEPNLGDYPNRNRAASYAKGKYLKYIDSDDVLYRHALSVFVDYLNSDPDCAIALAKNNFPSRPMPIVLSPYEVLHSELSIGGVLGNAPGSAMIRRLSFDAVGGFSGKNLIGDYELWLRLACRFPVMLIPGHTGWDRRHSAQESNVDPVDYLMKRLEVLEVVLSSAEAAQYPEVRRMLPENMAKQKCRCILSLLRYGTVLRALNAKRSLGLTFGQLMKYSWMRLTVGQDRTPEPTLHAQECAVGGIGNKAITALK